MTCHEETAILINQEKQAESYEFQFNEINLPSSLLSSGFS